MPTPRSMSAEGSQGVHDARSPHRYHLHGHGVQISYYSLGAGPLTGEPSQAPFPATTIGARIMVASNACRRSHRWVGQPGKGPL
jgi:hypothetical protein